MFRYVATAILYTDTDLVVVEVSAVQLKELNEQHREVGRRIVGVVGRVTLEIERRNWQFVSKLVDGKFRMFVAKDRWVEP